MLDALEPRGVGDASQNVQVSVPCDASRVPMLRLNLVRGHRIYTKCQTIRMRILGCESQELE
jgi:hypothetical protein